MKCQICGAEIRENAKFCSKCGSTVEASIEVKTTINDGSFCDIKDIWPEWQIEKQLGKGSYGVVYQAIRRDNNVESHAAIKIISIPSDSSEVDSLRSEGLDMDGTRTYFKGIVDDFVSEIQLMESLKGIQNIVSVEDYKVVEKKNTIGWDIYIRMELLTPFNTYICDRTLSEEEIIKLGTDICSALEICGQRNIIHRDIKPENIFVNDFGHFKLGDFGIARKLENMTGGLSQKGTFNYMAPEVANSNEYDARVDIYSLGIVLYRLLNNNKLPFLDTDKQLLSPNERKLAVERRIKGESLPAPCNASPSMANLILRACAYNPNARFSSASEMKRALMSVSNATYIIEDMELDKTTSVRSAGENYDGTTAVRKAPNTSVQGSQMAVNTFGENPKKKSKLPIIIVSVLAVIILVVAGIFFIPKLFDDNDGNKSNNNTDKTSTSETKQPDDEEIDDNPSSETDQPNDEEIDDNPSSETEQPNDEEIDHNHSSETDQPNDETENDTILPEDDFSDIEEKEIASIISKAENLADMEDYEGALNEINYGLIIYPTSENLKNKSDEYNKALASQIKEDNLEKAEMLAASGDFLAAMNLIKEAQEKYGDDEDYQNAYDSYNQSYITNVKVEALESAEGFVQQGDYLSAYEKIQQAIDIIGDDAELVTKAELYEKTYVTNISSQIDILIGEKKIVEAKELLKEAMDTFPNNNTLMIKSKELEKYKTTLLNTLNPINGGFTWNEGTPEDPFGSSYGDIQNYAIMHEDNHYRDCSYSAEYKIDQQYDYLTFTISPYSDFKQNCKSYIQIYADDILKYTSTYITQKTQPQTIRVDVHGATYIKIVIKIGADSGCIMLSNVTLSCESNYVSSTDDSYTSLATLNTFNGGFSWNDGFPENTRGDDYTTTKNYSILHEDNHYRSCSYSAEYFLNQQYSSLSFNVAPLADFGATCTSYVKVYLDDILVYTSAEITQKTALFNTGNIDVSKTSYLKIVVEIGADNGCLILSDALLKNK